MYSVTLTYLLKVEDSNRDNLGTSNMIISQTVIDRANITIDNTGNRLWAFNCHTIKVKIMHVLTANTSPTITGRAKIAIAIK